ncbi:MAG: hypothetical protein GC154_08960 [bacterium]|nr:hypothetical protein [bacterium]
MKWKEYALEFITYTLPLLTYSFIGMFENILERWMLQSFSGSAEQGFFGLSNRVGEICFLFTGALTPLLLREYAKAFGARDFDALRSLFKRYVPFFYCLSCYFAVFIAMQSAKISLFLGGEKFREADWAMAIMAFYPLHRTYGSLSSNVFFATNQTKLFRNISIISQSVSLPAAYFLLAPASMFGLNLGSTGLALKMVLVQCFSVNLQLWFNCRYLKLPFMKFVFHQIYSIAVFAVPSYAAIRLAEYMIQNDILSFLTSGFIYSILSVLIVYFLPGLIMMSAAERDEYVSLILSRIKRISRREGE